MRLRRSTSSTRFIRANESTTPPRWAVQPPASPVPAPRAITGVPLLAAGLHRGDDLPRRAGKDTASGGRRTIVRASQS